MARSTARPRRSLRRELLRARDESKDQSYFLWGLSQEQLSRSDFPLGELTKAEVRALARRANLGAAKSCSLVIIFMIRPPTVVQRIGLRQPIAAFSWLAQLW